MPALKARIGGEWVDVGGAGGPEEVFVGDAEPALTYDLWVDTDEPVAMTDDLRWNAAWGMIAFAHTSAVGTQTISTIALVDVTGLSVTWTPVVGRRYRTTVTLLARKITATGDISVVVADAANTNLGGSVMTLGINGYGPTTLQIVDVPATAAPLTRKVQVHPGSASAVITPVTGYYSMIVVEDIGPASAFVPAPDPTPAWTNVTFTGTWVNFGGLTQATQYRKIGDQVYVRGFVKSGTIGTSAFTLPVGYRPPALVRFPISGGLGTGAGLPNVGVSADGTCVIADCA
ncbi:MAG TPA: hypothetical protein VFP09_10990, partial [Desertimonas sp.]|nr:hypothetical protein [Desertimonas sp.]